MDADDLRREAEALRASGALGRSGALTQLFDFLVDASARAESPKEVEIASAVFGKAAAFDGGQDATVRVYVHRLRKKLEDYYSGPGRGSALRLGIPKGEYRLVATPADAAPPAPPAGRLGSLVPLALAALVLVNALAWAGWWWSHRDPLDPVRRAAPWAQLLDDDRPLLVVLGDYYIFGDVDDSTGAGRLVREYGVNSREELDSYIMDHPDTIGRYRDLDLFYLPTGVAAALREVMPVVAKGRAHDDVRVVMASDLTPEMLKRADVLYLGYLSGLRLLREPVFAGSRFRVGETYDELVDTVTNKTYASQEGGPDQGQSSQRDFGYLAAFPGPQGGRIVVLAGARDIGLAEAAGAATRPAVLKSLKAANRSGAFEALFEAEGLRRAPLGSRLIVAAPLAADRIWAPPKTPPAFPAG